MRVLIFVFCCITFSAASQPTFNKYYSESRLAYLRGIEKSGMSTNDTLLLHKWDDSVDLIVKREIIPMCKVPMKFIEEADYDYVTRQKHTYLLLDYNTAVYTDTSFSITFGFQSAYRVKSCRGIWPLKKWAVTYGHAVYTGQPPTRVFEYTIDCESKKWRPIIEP
jgi:hypothetical protein